MDELSTPARSATLDRLERESFDCAVIGGGISGAGVAREASLRGLIGGAAGGGGLRLRNLEPLDRS